MPDDFERRLEEVFMDDSRSRRVERVDVRSRRRSPLLVPLALAGSAALALAVGLSLGALRDQRQDVAAPSASPGAISSPAAAAPSASPTGSPAARGGEYTSPLGYTVQLPTGWRRSELLSRTAPLPQGDTESLAADLFTIRAAADEQRLVAARTGGTGLGPELFYTASVTIDRNTRGLDPRAFAQRNQGAYGFQVVSIEDHPFEGRVGAKTTWRVTGNDPRAFYAIYLPDETRRIWTIGFFLSYSPQDIPPGATEQALRSIVDSFRFFAPASANPSPATGVVPAEDLGIVTFVEQRPGGQTTVLVRGERDARAFTSLGAIGLTSDGRNAGAVSPDGKRFAFWQPEGGRAGGASKRLLLWDAADPTRATTLLEAPAGEFGDAVVWSSDGRGLLLSYASVATLPGTPIRRQYGVLRLYDLTSRAVSGRELQRDGALTPLAWDRASGRIAYFTLSGSNANAYRVESEHDPSSPISVSMAGAYHLSGSPDGAWVVARVATRLLRAWPRESPERAVEIAAQSSETLSHHGWRPGTNEILVADHALVQPGFGASVVSLWDPSTGRRSELAGARTMPFAFRADGSAVYLATGAAPWRYVIHEIAAGRRSDLPAGPEDAHIVAGVRLR